MTPSQIRSSFFDGTLHRGALTLLSELAPSSLSGGSLSGGSRVGGHVLSMKGTASAGSSVVEALASAALDEEKDGALHATGGRLQACLTARQFLAGSTLSIHPPCIVQPLQVMEVRQTAQDQNQVHESCFSQIL